MFQFELTQNTRSRFSCKDSWLLSSMVNFEGLCQMCICHQTANGNPFKISIYWQDFVGLGDFIRKTHFRISALRVAKVTIDVEKEMPNKKGGIHNVTSAIVDQTLYQFLESACKN